MQQQQASDLGKYWGFILFVALMGAIPPLATDMYLGAMPKIAKEWHVPLQQVNLSLVLWFVAFSVSLLFCGAISDRVGRRPVLIWGVALFAASSFLCSLASNVGQLILFRILQGISAAAPSAMCLAICRDRFEGRLRQKILAWMGIVIGITPMIAPSLGAMLLQFAGWPWIFAVQATLGAILLALVFWLFDESAGRLEAGGLLSMLGRYWRLLCNRNFVMANLTISLLCGPLFAYVAFSSNAYIQIFGLSESLFAVMFGANAIMAMAGSFFCTRLFRYFDDRTLLMVSIVGSVIGGVFLLTLGSLHYLLFALGVAIYTFSFGMSRPLGSHLILEQVMQDIGAASSTIIFTQFMLGAICMAIATYGWQKPMLVFSVMTVALPVVVLLAWPSLRRRLKFSQGSLG
jgi:DHA1 family bicyclomycin/chloramphenicol resistance-like MFS transporter